MHWIGVRCLASITPAQYRLYTVFKRRPVEVFNSSIPRTLINYMAMQQLPSIVSAEEKEEGASVMDVRMEMHQCEVSSEAIIALCSMVNGRPIALCKCQMTTSDERDD